MAARPLTQAEVRQFMAGIARAAQARDVERLGAAVADDCRIELETRIGGARHVSVLDRAEYLAQLRGGAAALGDLESYTYVVDDQQVTLTPGAAAATVVSHVTETAVFGGVHQVTHSVETARVERRPGGLRLVAVTALTAGR